MTNFLSTTLVGIIMADRNLNIRKFTEYISTEFNVADQDVGRSLRYIAFNFATIDLMSLCRQVLATMKLIEKNCASVTGKTYLVRIAPYKAIEREKERDYYAGDAFIRDGSPDGRGESSLRGVVITFVDTTKQVNDQQQIEEMASAPRAAVKSGEGEGDLPVPHEPRHAHAYDSYYRARAAHAAERRSGSGGQGEIWRKYSPREDTCSV